MPFLISSRFALDHQQDESLTSNQLFYIANRMETARKKISSLLIQSSHGLQAMAELFLQFMSEGINYTELVNKTVSDKNKPIQTDPNVQEEADNIQDHLIHCFKILALPENTNPPALSAENLRLLQGIHFLPNFLLQASSYCISRFKDKDTISGVNRKLVDDLSVEMEILFQSRQALISANLKLVSFTANQYFKNKTMSFVDLNHEGIVGLIKAVDRFDHSRSVSFSTYAMYWIRQTITRSMVRHERLVRLPYNLSSKVAAVFEAISDIEFKDNKRPTVKELSEKCNINQADIETILQSFQSTSVSLYSHIDNNEEMPMLINTLEQHHFPSQLNVINSAALKKTLQKALKTLPEREADVLSYRFGLENDVEMTLQDIADLLNITRERVRQIQNSALNKLRNDFSVELGEFLDQVAC